MSSFVPLIKEGNTFSLDEDVDLSYRSIYSFSFAGTKYTVKTWREFFVSVMELLHERNSAILPELAISLDKTAISLALSTSNDDDPKGFFQRIADGIYLRVNNSTLTKVSLIKKYLVLFGVDPEEITITISDPIPSNTTSVTS